MFPQGVEEGPADEVTKASVTSALQGALAATRTWLSRVFTRNMFQTYLTTVRFTYPDEIAVSLARTWEAAVGMGLGIRMTVTRHYPAEEPQPWPETLVLPRFLCKEGMWFN
jgi:hypothetical protein